MASEPRCRVCQAHADVQLVDDNLTCRQCGAIFHGSASPPPRPSVALPPGVVARETEDSLFIGIRWFRPRHLVPIALTLIPVFGVLVFFGEFRRVDVHWTTYLLAPFPYIVFGLIGAYGSLAFLLNRTHVWVRNHRITVSQVPLPFARSRIVEAAEVDQLFTKADFDRHGRLASCDVCVFRQDGRWFRLVKDLATEEQALFLEWAIERHLGIPDGPVLGELRRRPPS